MSKEFTVKVIRSQGRESSFTGTLDHLKSEVFGYTLECGKSWEHEPGNGKVNDNPKSIKTLIKALNIATNNAAANGYSGTYYEIG